MQENRDAENFADDNIQPPLNTTNTENKLHDKYLKFGISLSPLLSLFTLPSKDFQDRNSNFLHI